VAGRAPLPVRPRCVGAAAAVSDFTSAWGERLYERARGQLAEHAAVARVLSIDPGAMAPAVLAHRKAPARPPARPSLPGTDWTHISDATSQADPSSAPAAAHRTQRCTCVTEAPSPGAGHASAAPRAGWPAAAAPPAAGPSLPAAGSWRARPLHPSPRPDALCCPLRGRTPGSPAARGSPGTALPPQTVPRRARQVRLPRRRRT
jgi:hypothetical protein